MGYTTDFNGDFGLDKVLAPEHKAYLQKFAQTRRMKRKEELTLEREDPIRDAAELPVGYDGAYFVGELGDFGQGIGHNQKGIPDLVDYNNPPSGQPSLWCQWTPSDDGYSIKWDGGEKFYNYVEWTTESNGRKTILDNKGALLGRVHDGKTLDNKGAFFGRGDQSQRLFK